jgi:hypothetical protein
MAENENAKVVAAGFAGTAIGAAIAWLNQKKAAAGEPVIPDEVVQLLIAIAAASEDTKQTVVKILAALGAGGQGWPANTDSITGLRVAINPAAGMQLPSIVIPSGMALVIKAWALNPAWLFVGPSLGEAGNINQSFPLLPSEVVTYQVENADQIYIAGLTAGGAPTAGCFACLTVEQRRRGGGI